MKIEKKKERKRELVVYRIK